LQITIKATFIS